jgi:two-component system, sensor histidine kinase ChiS
MFCITCFIAFTSFSISLHAQEKKYRFQYLTSDQGLTHNRIDCMLLDSKGFMWFGTWNGLNRFDGYNFTVYKGDPRNSGSLSGNFIYDLAEDREGNIWIGTENGLNVYLYQYDSFIHYNTDKTSDASISSDRIQVVFNDRNGFLWIGTDKGLDKLTIGPNGQINNYYHYHASDNTDGLTFNSVTSIYEDQKGDLWVGTSNGLNIIDGSTGTVIHLFSDPSDPGVFRQIQLTQYSRTKKVRSGLEP